MAVYFIRAGKTPYVKIGSALRPRERMAMLQIGNHEKLAIDRVLDGGERDERRIHSSLHAHWHRNEWFSLTREQVSADFGLADLPIPVVSLPGRRTPQAYRGRVEVLPECQSVYAEIMAAMGRLDIPPTAIGLQAANDAELVFRLRRGKGLTPLKMQRIRRFLDDHAGAAA